MNKKYISFLATAFLLFGTALPAHAYIGPGAGLGAIAITIAVILGILLLLAGFVWFPIKRRLKRKQNKKAPTDSIPSE